MNFKIKNRHRLKEKDTKKIIDILQKNFNNINIDKKSSIETGDVENISYIFIDNEPCFFYFEEKIIFTLFGLNKFNPKNKFVVIDMGAVKFITNGADVMAPGIVDADKDIIENDQVWICDERYRKPLAVGIALASGEQMIQGKKGKSIRIIHYVGDHIWTFVAKSI